MKARAIRPAIPSSCFSGFGSFAPSPLSRLSNDPSIPDCSLKQNNKAAYRQDIKMLAGISITGRKQEKKKQT
jgi:hypothetical protein